MIYFFSFMPSPSRYGRKREGHQCIEKERHINLIEMIVEIREIALFTRATPGSSLVLHISL